VLLTCKVAFAATDAITGVKLIEKGMPKDRLAAISVLTLPVNILLPAAIARRTSGPRPMDLWLRAYGVRLGVGVAAALIVALAPTTPAGWGVSADEVSGGGSEAGAMAGHHHHHGRLRRLDVGDVGDVGGAEAPQSAMGFYSLVVLVLVFHCVPMTIHFVSQMAFYARVSDPRIGGSYMTMLNTVSNLGSKWPSSLAFFLVGFFTLETGEGAAKTTIVDGYYVVVALSIAFGVFWLRRFSGTVQRLQDLELSAWHCGGAVGGGGVNVVPVAARPVCHA